MAFQKYCQFTRGQYIHRRHLDLLPVLALTKSSLKCNIRRTQRPLSSCHCSPASQVGLTQAPGVQAQLRVNASAWQVLFLQLCLQARIATSYD